MPYATADELKFELQQGNVTFDRDDALLADLVDEASEAIDQYCQRSFTVPSSATDRYYYTTSCRTSVAGLDDIANTTGLAVATGTDGTYTALATSDWFYKLDNKTGMVTEIRRTGSYFPVSNYGRPTIKVTARYGWPSVPGPIHRACIVWARRLYVRKDSPSGVLGFGDMGAVRLSTVDPDVQTLLNPYVDRSKLLA